jgi:hypothetical protein
MTRFTIYNFPTCSFQINRVSLNETKIWLIMINLLGSHEFTLKELTSL